MAQPVNNRTDLLNPPTYGDKANMARSKAAMPTGPSPSDVQNRKPSIGPGQLPSLLRPTERPNSPITTGANFGPGMNALQAGIPIRTEEQMAVDEIRAIVQIAPTDDLLNMLDRWGLL
jgi:hypothetical protein